MGWKTANERFKETAERLVWFRKEKLSYGVKFLDQALRGILPVDLVLVGAPSGAGKTGFVTNLALKNTLAGKKVHVIALESYEGEVEDRIHYQLFAKEFYEDPDREPHVDFSFQSWREGLLDHIELKYKENIAKYFEKLTNLSTFYYNRSFNAEDFIRQAFLVEAKTDLIIVDHVHYFDIEDQNENRGMKALIKEIRNVQATIKKPIVLVSHLRKKDKKNPELCAGIDEFHGSSDLTKIATQVITMGKGEMVSPNACYTYFRIPKSRWDGSVTFYCGKTIFSMRKSCYEDRMEIGKLVDGDTKWEVIEEKMMPTWATRKLTPIQPPQSSSILQVAPNLELIPTTDTSSEPPPGF